MNPGTLNMRCVIQRRGTPVRDNEGGEGGGSVWIDVVHSWCKIDPKSGTEYNFFRMQQTKADESITMRYVPGILPEFRIIVTTNDGPVTFNIVRVDNLRFRQNRMVLWVTYTANLPPL